MTSTQTKKRRIYLVYAFLFMFGGIEYSVIIPTLWLYLSNTYDAPENMLGMVLSAYSVACLFSAPILGRLADRFGHTKQILIFCSLVQVIGSFLYLVGISQWLCLASRFICGIGGAAEAVALAEVSRYAPKDDLTGIMSKMVAMRQIALVAAPGLNIVLRLFNFKIGPIEVNKYTAPGAFMTIIWLALIVIIIAFYSEPRDVDLEERREKRKARAKQRSQRVKEYSENFCESINNQPSEISENGLLSGSVKTSNSPPVDVQENHQPRSDFPEVEGLGSSYDVMVTAEKLILSSEQSGHEDSTEVIHTGSFDFADSWSLIDRDEVSLLMSADGRTDSNDIQTTTMSNEDYFDYYLSNMDDPIALEGKMGFFCKEYIRDEVMAIIMLLFCAFFSQVALETMVTPLSQVYMDFGELENSILYSLSGVEIVIVFLFVSWLSTRIEDRTMILFGGFLLLAANIWLIVFLPNAPKHNESANLPSVVLAVGMDVLSLPFLLVCATSLYSKMTRKETQGVSQGLRRGIIGLGTILAPMWASSIIIMPYLVLGVLIGIQSLSLLMCVMSFSRLKALEPNPRRRSTVISNASVAAARCCSPTISIEPSSGIVGGLLSSQYGSISSVDAPSC